MNSLLVGQKPRGGSPNGLILTAADSPQTGATTDPRAISADEASLSGLRVGRFRRQRGDLRELIGPYRGTVDHKVDTSFRLYDLRL